MSPSLATDLHDSPAMGASKHAGARPTRPGAVRPEAGRPEGSRADEGQPEADEGGPTVNRPVRTCVGCGEAVSLGTSTRTEAPGELVRIVVGPLTPGEGGDARPIALDPSGKALGRGAHLHPRPGCVKGAVRGGLSRSVKSKVTLDGAPVTEASLSEAIAWVFDRRVEGLIGAAKRAKRLAIGSDAVVGACRRGEAALVVVAVDAASAATLGEVREAISAGRAASWGTKERLARAALSGDRPEGVGVLAVTDDRIGPPVAHAIGVVDSMRGGTGSNGGGVDSGRASDGSRARGRRSQAVE